MKTQICLAAFLLLSLNGLSQTSMFKDVSDSFLHKLIDTAKAHYPHVRIQNNNIAIAETLVKKANRSWFDVFSFSFLYSPKNTTTLVSPSLLNGYQVGLTANLGSMLQKPIAIKLAKLEVQNSKAEKEEYLLAIENTVKQRYYLYIQYRIAVKLTLEAGYDIESALQKIKYKFEKGEVGLEEYNFQLNAYNKSNQEQIASQANLMVAKSSLEEILGVKLEAIK